MDRHVDFTYNKKTYAGLPEFVRAMKRDGLRYIIILVGVLFFETSCQFIKLVDWFTCVFDQSMD